MRLHEIKSHNKKSRKRVGRGGKRGTTAGRGTKGQRSRAGHKIRPAISDLFIRIPKKRGFRNKAVAVKPLVIDIALIAKKAGMRGAGTVIDKVFLKTEKLIPGKYRGEVKVLGKAKIEKPMMIKGLKVSESVRLQIEKTGGKIE